ncbi:HNH endonuclease signature motif containing protein [Paracoccus cavernae]|uniref:Putative HNH nuclease YajD n=2 Tax=Paracoccus cavernae TaxID=1571207 RepID=A0ABT8D9G9_9RHOB|nr:HNH endonuclease signature motif containing protein [Paracoccus cavernae]
MARLKQLTPRVGALQQRVRQPQGQARVRDQVYAWRRWYKTGAWQRLRWQCISAALFTCARCARVADSPDLVADHFQPHRGDERLFWDPANLQCLCKSCHDGAKQREERAGHASDHRTAFGHGVRA